MGVPLLGYAMSSFATASKNSWISLGSVATFPEGETRLAVYRNPEPKQWDGDTAEVFRVGCAGSMRSRSRCSRSTAPISAALCAGFPESRLFMCPCHGGAFYEDGSRASGPPPRGLYQYEHKVEGGELKLLGGRVFRLSPSLCEKKIARARPMLRSIALWLEDRLHIAEVVRVDRRPQSFRPAPILSWFMSSAAARCCVSFCTS